MSSMFHRKEAFVPLVLMVLALCAPCAFAQGDAFSQWLTEENYPGFSVEAVARAGDVPCAAALLDGKRRRLVCFDASGRPAFESDTLLYPLQTSDGKAYALKALRCADGGAALEAVYGVTPPGEGEYTETWRFSVRNGYPGAFSVSQTLQSADGGTAERRVWFDEANRLCFTGQAPIESVWPPSLWALDAARFPKTAGEAEAYFYDFAELTMPGYKGARPAHTPPPLGEGSPRGETREAVEAMLRQKGWTDYAVETVTESTDSMYMAASLEKDGERRFVLLRPRQRGGGLVFCSDTLLKGVADLSLRFDNTDAMLMISGRHPQDGIQELWYLFREGEQLRLSDIVRMLPPDGPDRVPELWIHVDSGAQTRLPLAFEEWVNEAGRIVRGGAHQVEGDLYAPAIQWLNTLDIPRDERQAQSLLAAGGWGE